MGLYETDVKNKMGETGLNFCDSELDKLWSFVHKVVNFINAYNAWRFLPIRVNFRLVKKIKVSCGVNYRQISR